MKLIVIYNPLAGFGRAQKLFPRVKNAILDQCPASEFYVTKSKWGATEYVRKLDMEPYDGLIVAGGDGVLFEVINGYFANPGKQRIPIGILPVGTGNAFARELGLDKHHWADAIEIILRNHPRRVDAGVFETEGHKYYFLNIIGLGFVADVNRRSQTLKWMGNFSYTLAALLQIALRRTVNLTISLDETTLSRKNIFTEISNTRYTSNFLMAPRAEIDDGLLDVTLLNETSRTRLIANFPKIFSGQHVALPEVEIFKAREICIETEHPCILTPDGELIGATPVTIRNLHKAIEVFWT